MPQEMVEIYVDLIIKETTDAILCEIGSEQVWIPKSQLGEESDVREAGDGNGVISIPVWLAEKKELV